MMYKSCITATLLAGFLLPNYVRATEGTEFDEKTTLLKPEEVQDLNKIETAKNVSYEADEKVERVRPDEELEVVSRGQKSAISSFEKIRNTKYSDVAGGVSLRPPKLDLGKLELMEDEECDDDRSDVDTYSIFMKNYHATAYVVKCMTMMIHFGGYLLDAIDFNDVEDENSPIKFTTKMDRFPYPTYGEVFGGMYTNYAVISTILSLKACSVYYSKLNEKVAEECRRYSKHLVSFQKILPIDQIFEKNPLVNDKIEDPPKYTARDILDRIVKTIAALDKILAQDFAPIIKKLEEISKNEGIIDEIYNSWSETPDYKPQENLDLVYTDLWKMLFKPIEENMIILHNYFNDAANIDHFIENVDEFLALPKSRPALTMAWKDLARKKYTLKDNDFGNLIFYILRSVELNRVTASMPYSEMDTVDQPKNLYTLVDTAFHRNEEPTESNFVVVV